MAAASHWLYLNLCAAICAALDSLATRTHRATVGKKSPSFSSNRTRQDFRRKTDNERRSCEQDSVRSNAIQSHQQKFTLACNEYKSCQG